MRKKVTTKINSSSSRLFTCNFAFYKSFVNYYHFSPVHIPHYYATIHRYPYEILQSDKRLCFQKKKTVYTAQMNTRDMVCYYMVYISICWKQHLNFIRKSLHLKVFKCVKTDVNFPLSIRARRLLVCVCVSFICVSVHALGIIVICRLFSTFYPFSTESFLSFSIPLITHTAFSSRSSAYIHSFIHYGIRVSIYLVHFNICDYMYIHIFSLTHLFAYSLARSHVRTLAEHTTYRI